MRYLSLLLLLAGCGGGGGTSPPPTAPQMFPPFDQVRSDFIDRTEGLASNPLKVALPPCVNLPPAEWQVWLCSMTQALPTVYPQTNGFSTATDPYYSWIISSNNEFLQTPGCNTGPPNQSLGPNDYPFAMQTGPHLKLTVLHDGREFCEKIPYMSATYIRGVQGDARGRLLGWRELPGKILEIDVDIQRAHDSLAWFRVITHYRDPRTGQRYFINKDYVMPDNLPDYLLNWNWPYKSSFQYPGAIIMIPARVPTASLPNGVQRIAIPLQAQALQYFPIFASAEPDFLGVEIAVELGPVQNVNSVTIRSVVIR